VITPGAVVADIHAFLTLAGGFDQTAIGIEDSQVEEGLGLLPPNADTGVIEDILKKIDVLDAKAPAEISRRGWVGDAVCAESIEENSVVAAQFNVLQAIAVAQGIDGNIEHVIGLMVGQVDLQQVEPPVDSFDQTDALGKQVKGADAAKRQTTHALGNLVGNVKSGEHRFGTVTELGLVEPAQDLTLAVGQLLAYLGFHSKSLSPWGL
jgi:hypothetical protein